ncbi:hypothetical protein D3C85_653690 [compost metagenome]
MDSMVVLKNNKPLVTYLACNFPDNRIFSVLKAFAFYKDDFQLAFHKCNKKLRPFIEEAQE